MKRALIPPVSTCPAINIWGERYVEWSFLSNEMPDGPGEAIEFGCEQGESAAGPKRFSCAGERSAGAGF